MIPKLFSNKFLEKAKQMNIGIPQLLGFYESKLIFYPFITSKGMQDVRLAFHQSEEDDKFLIRYYKEYITDKMPLIEKAKAIAEAVNSRMAYQDDMAHYGQAEFWNTPIGAHNAGIDDCDGSSVLITYLLRLFGAEENEVFTTTGYVKDPLKSKEGFHAYTSILDKETALMYPVEGSFYPKVSMRELGELPLHLNVRYRKVLWITNDKVSYSSIPMFRFVR